MPISVSFRNQILKVQHDQTKAMLRAPFLNFAFSRLKSIFSHLPPVSSMPFRIIGNLCSITDWSMVSNHAHAGTELSNPMKPKKCNKIINTVLYGFVTWNVFKQPRVMGIPHCHRPLVPFSACKIHYSIANVLDAHLILHSSHWMIACVGAAVHFHPIWVVYGTQFQMWLPRAKKQIKSFIFDNTNLSVPCSIRILWLLGISFPFAFRIFGRESHFDMA